MSMGGISSVATGDTSGAMSPSMAHRVTKLTPGGSNSTTTNGVHKQGHGVNFADQVATGDVLNGHDGGHHGDTPLNGSAAHAAPPSSSPSSAVGSRGESPVNTVWSREGSATAAADAAQAHADATGLYTPGGVATPAVGASVSTRKQVDVSVLGSVQDFGDGDGSNPASTPLVLQRPHDTAAAAAAGSPMYTQSSSARLAALRAVESQVANGGGGGGGMTTAAAAAAGGVGTGANSFVTAQLDTSLFDDVGAMDDGTGMRVGLNDPDAGLEADRSRGAARNGNGSTRAGRTRRRRSNMGRAQRRSSAKYGYD